MSEFHDPELRHELAQLSGPYPDDNAAFAAWQRRVGQARRRRAMAWTTGAAMSLIVGVVAVAALQGQNGHTFVPQKATESTVKLTTTVATTPARPLVITESTDASTTTTITVPEPETTPSPEVVVTMPQSQPGDTGMVPVVTTHKAKPGSSGPAGPPPTPTTESTATTDTNDSQVDTQTFVSIGGTITVHQFRGHLSVVDITPADGFSDHESGHSGHGVGVTFTSDSHRSEISVWMDNGTMKHFVTEKDETHRDSGPPNSFGSGGGGDGGYGG